MCSKINVGFSLCGMLCLALDRTSVFFRSLFSPAAMEQKNRGL
jgi:hypothetical protein